MLTLQNIIKHKLNHFKGMDKIRRGFCSYKGVCFFFVAALFCGHAMGQVVEKRTFMAQKTIDAFDNTTFCTAYLSDGMMYTMRDIAVAVYIKEHDFNELFPDHSFAKSKLKVSAE